VNTIELSVGGGDAALCQITLATCYHGPYWAIVKKSPNCHVGSHTSAPMAVVKFGVEDGSLFQAKFCLYQCNMLPMLAKKGENLQNVIFYRVPYLH